MAEYYRSVFSIAQEGVSGARLLDSARDAVREWVADDFGPRHPVADEPRKWTGGAGELSEIERRPDGENLATFRVKWERPDPDDEIGRWRMSVRLATEGADVEADIEVLGSESVQPAPRPEYVAALPSIPHRILDEFNCRLDGRRMTASAKRIGDDAEARAFVNGDLLNPKRRLPLVVVSQDAYARGADADPLQERLLGLARVVWHDHDTAWNIARDMPRALRCYDGAVRLYAPGCSEDDVSQQNPYWLLGDALRLQSGGKLWMLLRDECVNRVPRHARRRLYAKVRRRIQDAERAEEIQALSEMEGQISERERLVSERVALFTDAYRAIDDRDAPDNPAHVPLYRRWARAFKNRNAMLKIENASLKSEVKRLKAIGGAGKPVVPAPTSVLPAAPRDFKTVREAVDKADKSLDNLMFFPTAFESADESQFRRPEAVYRAFKILNDCAKARGKGRLGQSVTSWLSERGVEYAAGESEKTDQQYIQERTFCDVHMSAHVKIGGNELRIHLAWQDDEGKCLIGHVGKHLPTSRHNS